MITEDYVSFEIAKLLKEKGFEECPLFRYDDCGHLWVQGGYNKTIKWHFPAPTLQMAMKWLREVHNIDIFPWKIGKGIYSCAIFNSNTGQDLSSDKDFPSEKYEETAEAAVKYCLENLI
jgi:hypothetical protein